jgi:mono/diheme cytochrome c family protein
MRCFLGSLSILLIAACRSAGTAPPPSSPFVQAATPEAAGHYLFLFGGCNDCHTPGWSESNGKVPEAEWGVGKSVGFRGPWGTSYPENLRLAAAETSERDWVATFRKGEGAPPMPWMNYRAMPEPDLLAIQRFLRSLGKRGERAPATLPPGKEPATPYIDFTPKKPAATAP